MPVTEPPAALDLEVACTDDLAAATAPWRALSSALRATPFLSPEWHAAWWRTLGSGVPRLYVARRDGEAVALGPFARRDDGVVVFSGGELTDVLEVLAVDDEALRAVARAVASSADEFALRYVPDGSRSLAILTDALREVGFAVDLSPLVVSPRLALPATFEAYLASLTKKDRHELRRKLRRLEKNGRVEFAYVGADEREAALARFFAWHRRSPGEKGRFMTAAHESFFREAARAGGGAGWLRLGELRLDGRAIGVLFAVEWERTLAAYNSAVDPDARALSPGILMHAHAIRDAIARGLETYDLLRGDEPYKTHLGGVPQQLFEIRAQRGDA